MLIKIFFAWFLLAATVTIHAAGLAIIFRPFFDLTRADSRFPKTTWRIIRVAWWMLIIHMLEIAMWGLFYWWQKCMPDAESAFYFAGVTYTTIGYGDLVLPVEWRIFGPIEGLTGILMCGLSTASFFAVVRQLYRTKTGEE